MRQTFKLTDEEHKKMIELHDRALNTPVIVLGKTMTTPDLATTAWNEVRAYMDELGKKYGYDPKTAIISKDSPQFEAEKK